MTLVRNIPIPQETWSEPGNTPPEDTVLLLGQTILSVMQQGRDTSEIDGMRGVIDDIDMLTMAALAARVAATAQVSEIKAATDSPAMNLSRESVVIQRASSVGEELGVRGSLVDLYVSLMGRARQQHGEARRLARA